MTNGSNNSEGLRLYTDGSKMGNKTGYGAVLLDSGDIIADSVNGKLSDNATVFQAKCVAMDLGLTLIEDLNPEEHPEVTILTDSQALVKALHTHEVNSQCINNLRTTLNTIGGKMRAQEY